MPDRRALNAVVLLAVLSTAVPVHAETLALAISSLRNPFFVALKEGAEAKASALGHTLLVLDSANDPAAESRNVLQAIGASAHVLLLNPTDSEASRNAVRAAQRRGIPVVTVDRRFADDAVAAHVASDNVAGGRLAAAYAATLLPAGGAVVELQGVPGTSAAADRGRGFHEGLEAATGLTLAASRPAAFDRTMARRIMADLLQTVAVIDLVFAHNDEMALGAADALHAAGRRLPVIGFDGTGEGRAAVAGGRLAATVAQQAGALGAIGVETADSILRGRGVPPLVEVSVELVTR